MNTTRRENYLLAISLLLFCILVTVSMIGLFTDNFYWRETTNWATQAIAQDLVDLFFIAPILLISSILAYKNNFTAMVIWGGTLLFLIYTFAIYCFSVHFNVLFIPYCFAFGLSIYSFIYFLYLNFTTASKTFPVNNFPRKSTAIFLLLITAVFYILWFSEIIPATINDSTPKSIVDTGVLTNPIHVIDLSVCLPGIILTSVLLLKKDSVSLFLIPAVLVFCTEMSLSIAGLMVAMKSKDQTVDVMPLYFMGIITIIGIWIFIKFIRSLVTTINSHYKVVT